MHLRTLLLGCILLTPMLAQAEPQCTPSNAVLTSNYPGARKIPTNNNLLQPTGKAEESKGQKLMITGTVRDSRCMPVADAVVELWQNNAFGRWMLAGGDDLASARPVFAGAGRTYTDAEGNFTFITAFPAPLGKRAPFVNVKVKAEKMPSYASALFFSDDERNVKDEVYRKLKGKTRGDTTISVKEGDNGDLTGTIDLVLPGKTPYRTY